MQGDASILAWRGLNSARRTALAEDKPKLTAVCRNGTGGDPVRLEIVFEWPGRATLLGSFITRAPGIPLSRSRSLAELPEGFCGLAAAVATQKTSHGLKAQHWQATRELSSLQRHSFQTCMDVNTVQIMGQSLRKGSEACHAAPSRRGIGCVVGLVFSMKFSPGSSGAVQEPTSVFHPPKSWDAQALLYPGSMRPEGSQ